MLTQLESIAGGIGGVREALGRRWGNFTSMMKAAFLQMIALLVAMLRLAAQSSVPIAAVSTVGTRMVPSDTLLGKWEQCATNWRKREKHFRGKPIEMECELMANVCAEFVFKKDHTGSYKSGGGFLQGFTWQVVNNQLTVMNTPARTKSSREAEALADGNYDLSFNPKELRFVEITLTDSHGISYILTK